jgi:acyl-CoA synthetase (AMP-forming)/AMP-acid ligase II
MSGFGPPHPNVFRCAAAGIVTAHRLCLTDRTNKMPDWSIPDRVVIADSIPHGATGKILKTELRRLYAGPPT